MQTEFEDLDLGYCPCARSCNVKDLLSTLRNKSYTEKQNSKRDVCMGH